jgi:hypothetical protein
VRERCADLLGDNGWRWRVLRTSNAYNFRDPRSPNSSKSEKPTETPNQDLFSSNKEHGASVRTLWERRSQSPSGVRAHSFLFNEENRGKIDAKPCLSSQNKANRGTLSFGIHREATDTWSNAMQTETDGSLIGITALAERLPLSRRTIHRILARGELPAADWSPECDESEPPRGIR